MTMIIGSAPCLLGKQNEITATAIDEIIGSAPCPLGKHNTPTTYASKTQIASAPCPLWNQNHALSKFDIDTHCISTLSVMESKQDG